MLSVNINQDVEQYQESVAFGLNARQTVAALLAILVGAGITCLLYFRFGISMQLSIYAALPFCIPIMLPVMGKQYGLTVTERIRQSNRKKRILTYSAMPEIKGQMKSKQDRQPEDRKGGRRKEHGYKYESKKRKPASKK